ncbi:MAG: recombinase family protein [Deltaproteobacteria bacterium]|nr:recombinase family protein [Deltaproteobacteria bacterium]
MPGKKKTLPHHRKHLVGYARVSTLEQDLTLQLDALKRHGCTPKTIFVDTASGARAQRPGLETCLAALHAGDVLVVWRLDRLGRSMSHLVTLVEQLRERGIGFRSLCDGVIDTTTASGELVFNLFSALAQFEQRLIQERTRAGLSAARARGRKGGRKPLPPTAPKVLTAKKMYQDRSIEVRDICQMLRISRSTLYRYVAMTEAGEGKRPSAPLLPSSGRTKGRTDMPHRRRAKSDRSRGQHGRGRGVR